MRSHLRAEFARAAYAGAILAVRAEPTSARWTRLLRAATNLREAERDWERDRVAGGWRGRAPSRSPPFERGKRRPHEPRR